MDMMGYRNWTLDMEERLEPGGENNVYYSKESQNLIYIA